MAKTKRQQRGRRHRRVRTKIKGTAQVPRLSVFRSNKYIFLQLIDDDKGKTIVAVSDLGSRPKAAKKTKIKIKKTKSAFNIGKTLAELAKKKKIKNVIFDRGGYAYHGRVKAAAEGAREGGLIF
jgi:large subunit ribosomal protein L18